MFSAKLILTALAFAVVAAAAPSSAVKLTQCSPTDLTAIKRNFANVQVCIRDTDPPEDCIILPIVDDTCLDLTGGLDRYNDVLSWVEVPNGYICEFFEDFDCSTDNDFVPLQTGDWDLFHVQGVFGTPNFNDLTSSIACFPD
ncbi:hypothetical protein B0H13DRAFT_1853925 [Mycena leptocephala]|nr:hypothetical protein B0H13DRAFT_1853925 [Mycena leptocephala]